MKKVSAWTDRTDRCIAKNTVTAFSFGYKRFSNPSYGTAHQCGQSSMGFNKREMEEKRYELSNHLGNVLVVVSDLKLGVDSASSTDGAEYYTPDVLSYSDYYPFGMTMTNRENSSADYNYGFNW